MEIVHPARMSAISHYHVKIISATAVAIQGAAIRCVIIFKIVSLNAN